MGIYRIALKRLGKLEMILKPQSIKSGVRNCVWNLTGLIAYSSTTTKNNKNSNKTTTNQFSRGLESL